MDLLVKNVPQELHERLRRHARASRRTMSEVVLDAVERELARQEWQGRFAGRSTTKLGVPAAKVLEQERAGRDEQLG
ncbi:MAG: hypothetical protein OXJ62_17110 [Spirochaetaceae bacterium]|nr:hypothetical protein [Spirochaetaceae bacterium]